MSTIPTATISRLVTYLRILSHLDFGGIKKTSSDHLAGEAQVSAFQVRKDLSYFGRFGTRGAGYSVPTLRRELRRILGLTRPWSVAIMGMGRLGHAIADYPNFDQYDFTLEGFFDIDPTKAGMMVNGEMIRHPRELPMMVKEKGIEIGFLTVPHGAAQAAADQLVAAGISGILNFAPSVINVPADRYVEPVDFMAGLMRLSFYLQNPQIKEG
jgi:redox-sensing transcriptional repressor